MDFHNISIWWLLTHQNLINWLTIATSVLYGLVIYTFLQSARIPQVQKWAIPFADTFIVLAVLYALRMITAKVGNSSTLSGQAIVVFGTSTVACLSGITNYLFVLSALRMPEPAIPLYWMGQQTWLKDQPYIKSKLLWIFIALSAVSAFRRFSGLFEIPDAVSSVVALFLMGLALYKNRLRTNSSLAWLALITSVIYAVIYFFRMPVVSPYLFNLVLDHRTATVMVETIIPLSRLIALFLKFGFFLAAFSLMLLIASPFEGIEDILRGASHEQAEFLESVNTICKKLGVNAVMLYVRQPDPSEIDKEQDRDRRDQIALFQFSGHAKPSDWPSILKYDETAIYHDVMTSGQAQRKTNEDSFQLLAKAEEFGVPVFFHGSVIACLTAVFEHGRKFPEEDRVTLRRFADFISQSVQHFRELSTLNRLSQQFGKYQIDIKKYNLEKDSEGANTGEQRNNLEKNIEGIAARVQRVTSPDLTYIQLERGFCSYPPVFKGEQLTEEQKAQYATELKQKQGDQDFVTEDGKYRWLTRELMIPESSSNGQAKTAPVFARFALGISADDIHSTAHQLHPTIGTDRTYRRAVSDLVGDALLDFIRGSLGELNDTLGKRLSGLEGPKPSDWHKQVETTAKDAGLDWVVVGYSDDDDPETVHLLHDDKRVTLINKLEGQGKWKEMGSDLWLCPIDQPAFKPGQVIRRTLKISQQELRKFNKHAQATLWIGVGRKDFGDELGEKEESEWGVSPWRYFLRNFCEIADAGFWRLLVEQRGVDQSLWMTELLRLANPTIANLNVAHKLAGVVIGISGECGEIERNIQNGNLVDVHRALGGLREIGIKCEELFTKLTSSMQVGYGKTSCIREMLDLVSKNVKSNIKVSCNIQGQTQIAMPFLNAIFALDNIISNACSAIGKDNPGELEIEVNNVNSEIVCKISDNGPGIPEDIRQKLFKQPTTGRPDGHGWGLRLSLLAVRGFNGKIVLEPQDPGGGAAFRVHFPTA